jgi:PAS domain S-box-containing protein
MTSRKPSLKNIASVEPDEQTFHLMFENHSAIMLLIEPLTGVILDANQAAVNFYGYPKSKLCRMSIQEINTLPAEQVALERQKALSEERNYFVFPHKLASGEERIVEVQSSPITLQEKDILFSIIHDITERERKRETIRVEDEYLLKQMVGFTEELLKTGTEQVSYQKILENLLYISKAKYGILTLLNKSTGKFTTLAVAGLNDKIIKLSKILGFEPVGKEWNEYSIQNEKLKDKVVARFSSLSELSKRVLPETISRPIEKLLNMGEVAVTKVIVNDQMIGDFTLIMPVGKRFENDTLVNIYSRQLDMFMTRIIAGEALSESETMLKKVQGIARLGSWEIDLTTKTMIASDEAHRIYGVAQGSMTMAFVQSIPLPEFRPILDAALSALIKKGKSYDVEFKIQRISDGELRDIHSAAEYNAASQTIIGSVQDITDRKRSEESIHQRVLELETINRISLVMRSASKQNEMLAIVLNEALDILNTPHGSIELYNKARNILEKNIARGWTAQVNEPPQNISEGIAGKVFTSGDAYISRELASDPETRAVSRSQIPVGWGGACLPIRTTQKTLGVMMVSVPSERGFDKDEIRLLSILSEMAGAALQRMQLHEQTVRRLDQLRALRAVDQAISSSRDMHLTLNILLSNSISLLNVDAAAVLLLHPGSNLLELVAGRGFHTLLFESVNLSDSVAGRAIMEHRPSITLDFETVMLRENPQFAKLWKGEGFVCYWCVPLLVKGEVKGVLEVYCRKTFTPDPEWLEFLEALAGQAAITIDNTQLFENLQRSNLDISLAYDATIEGWSRAMDLRDHETEGHTQRVTDLTLKLARVMRISESQLTAIRRGALLHDIGKMGVPDAILLKEGKLTDEEWVLMRKHPQLAHDMLVPIAYLNEALNIPYCHHEKWDGTGYPQGLERDRIPLTARIFAIVDVWDALTSDRPYRKKWTKQKAREYIKAQNGRHFDPQVVDAFLKTIGKG